MRTLPSRTTVLAVALLAGWLLAACARTGPADSGDVKFPDPKLATGPYTLVHFTADW